MHNDKANAIASADGERIKDTSIGYAINLIMDYGNGRQVTISGTLPLGATLQAMDAELDKLRLATNRQSALVVRRDTEAKLRGEEKMIAALDHMLASYEKTLEAELKALAESPTANHTATKGQLANMRAQAANYRQLKNEERERHIASKEICEVTIASINKELEEHNKI